MVVMANRLEELTLGNIIYLYFTSKSLGLGESVQSQLLVHNIQSDSHYISAQELWNLVLEV